MSVLSAAHISPGIGLNVAVSFIGSHEKGRRPDQYHMRVLI